MEKYDEYETELDDEDYAEIEEANKEGMISILNFFSTWFIRIGIVLAVILFIYYIVTGNILSAFLYLVGLVVAFFFGYAFMFLLDKFISAN